MREIKRKKPRSVSRVRRGEPSSLIVNLSDWQCGKSDQGGSEGILARIIQLQTSVPDRISDLRKIGYSVDQLVLVGLGDLSEGCQGFYPMQEFSVDLSRRQQTKVVRRGLTDLIVACAPHVPEILVSAVGGNHGENRKNGKAFTSFEDNDDVAVFEQVADIFQQSAFTNISFSLPTDRLAVSLKVQDQIVSWTHGHVARGAGEPIKTMWEWWKNQSLGRHYEGVADANILVCGHFHHFAAKQQEGRQLFICPTLEGGSDWWASSKGVTTAQGTLSFVVVKGGWTGLEIL
jgi:hypothetical protein